MEITVEGEQVRAATPSDLVSLDLHALNILSAFSRPRSLDEALELLSGEVQSPLDWAELSAKVLRLVEAGVLEDCDPSKRGPIQASQSGRAAGLHISMLNDRQRTSSYFDAIRQTVREGDVVVELGTGTGVLAVAAAQAGARHVYAIESGPIASAARQVFEANGVADRITLLETISTRASLPERADVLLSEIIGHEPLAERVLEYTADALARLVKPDARVIPRRLTIQARAVQVDPNVIDQHLFSARQAERWGGWYGMDLSALAHQRRTRAYQLEHEPWLVYDWEQLSEPFALARIDLTSPPASLDHSVTVKAIRPGRLTGIAVYFDLDLTEEHSISTDPAKAQPGCHWHCEIWIPPEPLDLQPGETFRVRYRHTLTGTTVEVARGR